MHSVKIELLGKTAKVNTIQQFTLIKRSTVSNYKKMKQDLSLLMKLIMRHVIFTCTICSKTDRLILKFNNLRNGDSC